METWTAGIIFVLGIVGAVISGRQKNHILMTGCIIVSTVMLFLMAATVILVWGID